MENGNMRKFYAFMIASLTILGCTREELKTSTDDVFYAQMEETDTKVYMDESKRIHWNANDLISIFKSTLNQAYRFKGETGATSGAFSRYGEDEFVTAEPLDVDANVAFYPYDERTSISKDGTISYWMPYDNVGNDIPCPMIAVTESKTDNLLLFKNVCSWVKVSLTGHDHITNVEIWGNDNEILTGKANIKSSYTGEPIVEMLPDGEISYSWHTDITLSDEPTSFYLPIPPMTFEHGFSIHVFDEHMHHFSKTTTKPQTFTRNVIKVMPTIEVNELSDYVYTIDGVTYPMPEAVDLGLPSGTKWASMNVGAMTEREKGLDIGTDRLDNIPSQMETFKKSLTKDIGDSWSVPTLNDAIELISNCEISETNNNGVELLIFTGTNGNSITMPKTLHYTTDTYYAAHWFCFYMFNDKVHWASDDGNSWIGANFDITEYDTNTIFQYAWGFTDDITIEYNNVVGNVRCIKK